VDKFRGLKGTFSNGIGEKSIPDFPMNLPAGPYQAQLKGSFYAEKTGSYLFVPESQASVALTIAGKPVIPGSGLRLVEGCYSIQVGLKAPAGPVSLRIRYSREGETGDLKTTQFSGLSYTRGLLGRYFHATNWEGNPVVTRWDPVINYVNGNDFNYHWGAPLAIHWKGVLRAPKTGSYIFMPQTLGSARLEIDHQPIAQSGFQAGKVHLAEGPHAFDVFFSQASGWWSSYSLVWIKPGDGKAEVIPNQYFGETRQ
jgi:hypothetical protein